MLEDISFEVHRGEVYGVVGTNGAGKSTLLKLIAGIYSIDSGNIRVGGRVAPLIELGVGFRPDLPGPPEHPAQRGDDGAEHCRDQTSHR